MVAKHSFSIGALLVAVSTVSAQQVIPSAADSSFPQCGLVCAVFVQQQSICANSYPGGSPGLTYDQCFCQATTLQPLYTTTESVCAGECQAPSDRALLQQWFINFCNQVTQGIDPNAASTQPVTQPVTQAPTAPSTTVVTITSTSSPSVAATITSNSSGSSPAPVNQQSWIESHWRWILMLGILAVALPLLAWLAIWLKRRHRRKVEERRAAVSGFPTPTEKRREGARSATPDLWGPHQHMAATKGWEYPAESVAGAIPDDDHSRRHERRRSRRDRPPSSRSLRKPEMSDDEIRPVSSRHQSLRNKGKDRPELAEVREESSRRHGSRSRSHRRKERDRDKGQDIDIEKGG